MPLTSSESIPRIVTPETMHYIQHVIKETITPSWINSVPHNYGDANAGTIKADEWRILSTVYLPIALVILWGDLNRFPPLEGSYNLKVLDHTMSLFQAVTLICQYTMNPKHVAMFCNFMKEWVDDLYTVHPHTKKHQKRTNIHISFHLYEFLLLFGPVISWWCFPFEHLIGVLHNINTNDKIGGGYYYL